MQGYHGDSWLLMIGSQIANLNPNPSFGHNLRFKNPHGSCKPILDIHVPRSFQWYKKILNPMSFDPCNRLIWECKDSSFHILLHSQEHEMWFLSSTLAHTFASPCLGCEPKVRVVTSSPSQPLVTYFYSRGGI
jgi:hypothetical protein